MDVYNPLPKTVLTSIISLSMILWLQMQLACMLATICKWLKTPTCHPSMLTSIWLQTNIWQQQPKCWCRCFKMQNGEVMMAFMFVFISNILKVILLLYIFLFSFFFKMRMFLSFTNMKILTIRKGEMSKFHTDCPCTGLCLLCMLSGVPIYRYLCSGGVVRAYRPLYN